MFESLNSLKIKIIDNSLLTIENYYNIIEIKDNRIIVDKYQIHGKQLIIKELDKYKIIIEGRVEQIEIF